MENSGTPGLITQSGLRAQGWTLARVRDELGQPDLTAPDPRHPEGARMRMWSRRGVAKAERGDPHETYHRTAAPVDLTGT